MDPYSQNSNGINNPYSFGGYEKTRLKKLLLIVVGVLVAIAIVATGIHFLQSDSQQSKFIRSATVAARKQTPNAKVTSIKVVGSFAIGTVSDPTTESQANIVNMAVFRVNKDGSMVQLARGSHFGSLDLLELGIPLATQTKLTGSTIGQVKQSLANQCPSDDIGEPGYGGFGGSFNPGGWEIDAGTLAGLEQVLSDTISHQNAGVDPGKAVVCVDATRKNSNFTTDKTTYISTFTLHLQFITSDGIVTNHMVTFAIGPNYYRNYTLDGNSI